MYYSICVQGSSDGTYSFLLQCKGGVGGSGGGDKDVVLRVDSVIKLIAWVNCLSEAGKLGYSDTNEMWLPGGRNKLVEGDQLEAINTLKDVTVSDDTISIANDNGDYGDEMVSRQRNIFVEGELEKKSPAHNLWQSRWFKLTTRQTEGANIYTLMWFKKKDSSVLKSLSADAISGLTLLSCARPIVYSQRDHCLHPSDLNNPLLVGAHAVKETSGEASTYSFVVQSKAGAGGGGGGDKDITLRTDSADRLLMWINSLAEAAGLEYCESLGVWQPGGRVSVVVNNPKAALRIASLSVDKQAEDVVEEVKVVVEESEESTLDDDNCSRLSHSHDHSVVDTENEEVEIPIGDVRLEKNDESPSLDTSVLNEKEEHFDEDKTLSDHSSDSEVDPEELQGVGNGITSFDFDRREPEGVTVPEPEPEPEQEQESGESDNQNPLHSNITQEVTPPVFDMSSFEMRGNDDTSPDVGEIVEIDDGGSDEDIREYRLSDCDDEQKLKPAGCSGCAIM